jgi:hypothetical protein
MILTIIVWIFTHVISAPGLLLLVAAQVLIEIYFEALTLLFEFIMLIA